VNAATGGTTAQFAQAGGDGIPITPMQAPAETSNPTKIEPVMSVQQHEFPHRKNLPPDFFTSAQVNLEACFGEAMQVVWDDRIIDPIPDQLKEIDRIECLRKAVLRWASGWDGVAYWPITLDHSLAIVANEGRQDKWQEQLQGHASMGRCLLAQLYSMGGQLPKDPDNVREIWQQQVELVEILVMGITILNIRCTVLPHGWKEGELPPVAYSDDSDISDSIS